MFTGCGTQVVENLGDGVRIGDVGEDWLRFKNYRITDGAPQVFRYRGPAFTGPKPLGTVRMVPHRK